jgi:hypothetical protein
MTKFTYTFSQKLTRSELAKALRNRADQLDGITAHTGELYIDEKGKAQGGVVNAHFTITGLKQ